MPKDNNRSKWRMPRETMEYMVTYAKGLPTLSEARIIVDMLEKAFRGACNEEAFALIDSITLHFKQEWMQEMRRQAERQGLTFGCITNEDFSTYPALRLLDRLVKDGKTPKDKLMPYRAAREAGVLLPSMPSVKDFNERFGTNLKANHYSTYINSLDNPYENDRDFRSFRTLVREFKGLKIGSED